MVTRSEGWRWPTIAATAVAAAICVILTAEPFGWGVALWGEVIALIVLARRAASQRTMILWLLVTGFAAWAWLHRWMDDVAVVGWLGLSLYMALWAPLFCILLRHVAASPSLGRWGMPLVAPTLWIGLECVRGIVLLGGYPWYLAGEATLGWPVAQVAAIGSVWLAGFLWVAMAAALADLRARRQGTLVLLCFLASCYFGMGRFTVERIQRLPVLVVQTNVPQDNKSQWTWEQQQADVSAAIALTREGLADGDSPALVIWPETMLPGAGMEVSASDFAPWSQSFEPLWAWAQTARALAAEIDVPLLVGTQTWIDARVDEEGDTLHASCDRRYNSAALILPSGEHARYDKIFLTPFGERMPWVEHWPWLAKRLRAMTPTAMQFNLSVGSAPSLIEVPTDERSSVRIATPICFEDTVPSVCRALVYESGEEQAQCFINLSNDGWFGDCDTGRLQHLRAARMRCIENRIPMIRVANTGISCYIDAYGRVVVQGPSRQAAAIPMVVQIHTRRPMAATIGDFVAWTCLAAGILMVTWTVVEPRTKSPSTDAR